MLLTQTEPEKITIESLEHELNQLNKQMALIESTRSTNLENYIKKVKELTNKVTLLSRTENNLNNLPNKIKISLQSDQKTIGTRIAELEDKKNRIEDPDFVDYLLATLSSGCVVSCLIFLTALFLSPLFFPLLIAEVALGVLAVCAYSYFAHINDRLHN